MNLQDDDFTLFGLPQRHALDRAELDARWRALQAEVHPDRFAAEGGAAQRLAMQWAVRVNQAYQRLKDPLSRGAYLAELRGAPVQADNNTAMPAAFLMQQMAWREALDEAESAHDLDRLDAEVAQHERTQMAALQQALDVDQQPLQAAQQVRGLMFVAKFRADLLRRLDALDA